MPKIFGNWTNDGNCVAMGNLPNCGPGNQQQIRTCTDGTYDLCTTEDILVRNVSCVDAETSLPNCTKVLGNWTNDGNCIATGSFEECGPGNQQQTRTCTDGTYDLCTTEDILRNVSCSDAGTSLTDCSK